MPKKASSPKTVYICDACGASFPRWSGQCSNCAAWNTLVETLVSSGGGARSSSQTVYGGDETEIISAAEVLSQHYGQVSRLSTNLYELDRVLGGGIVLGSVVLVGGEPGIGKSTIITQMIVNLLKSNDNFSALYVAGEESPAQIAQRIQRTAGVTEDDFSHWGTRLHFFNSVDVDSLAALIEQRKPGIVVIDSIQTLVTQDLSGMPGSVGQLREVTSRVVRTVKRLHIPTFLIGHVTKEGEIAGPKVLEHIVDSVLQISGERTDEVRMIRSLKNRFGPTDEVGLFRLTSTGAQEVSNPAEIFLEEKSMGQPGSALALCLEGSRPVVVEVQALVVDSPLPTPRRVARGINVSKLHLLLAVLHKHAKLNLSTHDVYINVVGSMEFRDPAIDLAVAAALISSKRNVSAGEKTVYCAEIGLLGEVRKVIGLEKRVKEAKRLGYSSVVDHTKLRSISQLHLK